MSQPATPQVIVIGGGAWGLPAALRLQDLGWQVTLLDRFEPGGPYASNGGSSRIWRAADTQLWRLRAAIESIAALERLGERIGAPVIQRTGVLWRDDESLTQVEAALDALGQPYERLAADRVGDRFPGLRPDGRDALFVPEAGIVHADRLLQGALSAFVEAGGTYLPHTRAVAIEPGDSARDGSARVLLETGEVLTADQVLVSAGPGTAELLPGLGIALPLNTFIEQVIYVGDPSVVASNGSESGEPAPLLPCLIDCPNGDEPGAYAMTNGPLGYKIGLDQPLRALAGGRLGDDLDRTPWPDRTEVIRSRVERDLTAIVPQVLGEQVCTWTDSGDGDFIIGRVHPRVVLACGDSGEGFKFSAFMGEYLASLVAGGSGDPDFQQHWDPWRLAGTAQRDGYSAIGRH